MGAFSLPPGQSPQSCESKLQLRCPTFPRIDDQPQCDLPTCSRYRCQLPGCPSPKLRIPPCMERCSFSTILTNQILSFDDQGQASICESTCLKWAWCNTFMHEQPNKCTLFPFRFACGEHLPWFRCSDSEVQKVKLVVESSP